MPVMVLLYLTLVNCKMLSVRGVLVQTNVIAVSIILVVTSIELAHNFERIELSYNRIAGASTAWDLPRK